MDTIKQCMEHEGRKDTEEEEDASALKIGEQEGEGERKRERGKRMQQEHNLAHEREMHRGRGCISGD